LLSTAAFAADLNARTAHTVQEENTMYLQARRQDLAARGPKTRRGPHFQNTVLDICSNQLAKSEMGGHRFQMGGPVTLPPRWRRPCVFAK